MTFSGRLAVLMAIFVIGALPSAAAPPPSDPALRDVLGLLHSGRFEEAEERARSSREARPDEPAVAFASAFVVWWRLLYDDESKPLQATFDERITHATEVGAAALGRRDQVEDRIWAGYSRLLCAQLRAAQKKSLAAAREAREAHRLLSEAAKRRPDSSEALFGLGTYNYYADTVSALVKGLRFLLGLPAGDREKGLAQLERAAGGSAYLSLESRLLRANIFAGKRERDYPAALEETGKALEVSPDCVVALDAAGRLDLVVGREDVSAARFEHALELARNAQRTDPTVRSALRLERARVEFARLRPDRTLEQLRTLRAEGNHSSARVQRDAERLTALSEWLTGVERGASPPPASGAPPRPQVWARIANALDREPSEGADAVVRDLRAIAGELPDDAVVKLHLGRALLRAGKGAEALAILTASDLSGALPEPWIGPYRLTAGQAADLSGDRMRARELYLKASKSPAFIELPATTLHERVPYSGAR